MSNPSFWQEKITLAGQRVPRFMTAPMDGVIDSPMRQIIREFSPDVLMFTEMRHVDMVANEPTGKSLCYHPGERPLVFQFSANRTPFIGKAVERVLAAGFTAVNLNVACPAPAVVRSGSGSALMAALPTLTIIIKELQRCLAGRAPLSIKMRAGFKQKNALEVAHCAQDLGCEAIIIHPRTQPERFTATLDYDLVATIKKTVHIPVIFSGNITKFDIAQRIYTLTGCDGFMIGRALWGTPWKLKAIMAAAVDHTFTIDQETVFRCIITHLNLNKDFYGQYGYAHFKKHLAHYIKAFANATQWRSSLLRTQSEEDMRMQLNTLIKEMRATSQATSTTAATADATKQATTAAMADNDT
jgi:tRNA-dihydrouridine synthase B